MRSFLVNSSSYGLEASQISTLLHSATYNQPTIVRVQQHTTGLYRAVRRTSACNRPAFQTKSTRSIRSVTRSDHGHRVDPREVDQLANDLKRAAQSTKNYGVF
ncbi:unnamed protein product [Strongylus vulgaris]|uniref:Uncharacterized protein n=1 Tax=Strongylus vulgaris TaxID=40348 RepID=A0A3P7JNI8_STRVU|nr:unnamed protein product [Strongylus vulgaris]